MRVGGDLLLQSDRKNQVAADERQEVPDWPMTNAGTRSPDKPTSSAWAFRYYDDAEATIKLENGKEKPSLRAQRRLIHRTDW